MDRPLADRRIRRYLASATRGLLGRERDELREELAVHVRSRFNSLRRSGLGASEAIEQVLNELGEPDLVNSGMSRLYNVPLAIGFQVARRLFQRLPESLLMVVALAVGVAALTAVVAVVSMNRSSLDSFLASMEARQIVIGPVAQSIDRRADAVHVGSIYDPVGFSGSGSRLQFSDLDEVRAAAPAVDFAWAWGITELSAGSSFAATAFSADFVAAGGLFVVEGVDPSVRDFEAGNGVMFVTPRYAARVGLGEDPLGHVVSSQVGGTEYEIVGIIAGDVTGPISLREAVIPFRPESDVVEALYFAVADEAGLELALGQVEQFAAERWGDAVTVSSPRSSRLESLAQQRTRGLIIGLFAVVSVLAALCNIVGLMLARVARRRKAIAIHRSLGATRSSVFAEVVLEAGMLGLVGGLLGGAAGFWLLGAYNDFLNADVRNFGVQVAFSGNSVLIGVLAAVSVSVIAALFPAMRASSISVVEGLGKA